MRPASTKILSALALLLALGFAAHGGIVTQSGPRLYIAAQEEDTTPDQFTFTDQTDVSLSSTITSAAITVAGINAAATITVSGGTYDVNSSGSFTSSSGSVNNGDTVRARHTSSGSNSTATNTTVTIGGVSDVFTSTTEAGGGGGSVTFTPESGWSVSSSDDFADGTAMLITGNSIDVKPNGSKALNVFTYTTNGNAHATWSRTTSNIAQSDGTYQTSPGITMPNNQVGVYRTDMTSSGRVSGHGYEFTGDKCLNVRRIYYGWNWLGAPANTNLKIVRVRSATGDHTLYLGGGFDGSDPQFISENTGGNSGVPNFNPAATIGAWMTNEIFYKGSTGDTWDARFDIFSNAKLLLDWGHAHKTKTSSITSALVGIYGDQISNNEEPAGSYIYTAFEYLDDSWWSFFLSTETSYQQINNGSGTSYTREYQIPWDADQDNSAEVLVRYGVYDDLDGLCLYHRNDAGTVFKVGCFEVN